MDIPVQTKFRFFPESNTLIISRSNIGGIAIFPGLRLHNKQGTWTVKRVKPAKVTLVRYGKDEVVPAENLAKDYFRDELWTS